MDRLKQQGSAAGSFILILLLVLALIFGLWAFVSGQSYKNDANTKIAAAVATAQKQTQQADAQTAAQQEENPLKDFQGPATYGSLHIKYPKTWSAYITLNDGGSNPINAYFQPDYVPDVGNGNSLFALRVVIDSNSYSQDVQQFASLATSGASRVTAYSLPKVPGVVGTRIDGQIINSKQGSMILMPLRDKTIEIWTESTQYLNDFNNNILPNVTFSP